jgi:hypothetical protein
MSNINHITYKSREWDNDANGGRGQWITLERGPALMLAFGTDFEELRDGVGQYSTAIIECPDGTVKNLPLDQIRFVRDE